MVVHVDVQELRGDARVLSIAVRDEPARKTQDWHVAGEFTACGERVSLEPVMGLFYMRMITVCVTLTRL